MRVVVDGEAHTWTPPGYRGMFPLSADQNNRPSRSTEDLHSPTVTSTRVEFPARDNPNLRLRGRLRVPSEPARGGVVLCHPHPAYGGHMDVWLLPTIAERLEQHGWASLRFDFRSAGSSAPTDGHAETGDLAGAIDLLMEAVPGFDRATVVGWSFGALVGLLHGPRDPRVEAWIGIGAPTRVVPQAPMAPPPEDLDRWGARRTVIVGEHDDFYPPDTVHVLHPDAVHIVPGADHFLFDRDAEVADLVVEALA